MPMLVRVTIPHETFDADVQLHPVMSADDHARTDLAAAGEKSAS